MAQHSTPTKSQSLTKRTLCDDAEDTLHATGPDQFMSLGYSTIANFVSFLSSQRRSLQTLLRIHAFTYPVNFRIDLIQLFVPSFCSDHLRFGPYGDHRGATSLAAR